MHLNPKHPALSEFRTIHTKTIKDPFEKTIFKPASANSKIGKKSNIITKGIWAGKRMFSLTLEERKTCPSSCERWATCYGNGMPFAHRMESGVKLESKVMRELAGLQRKHPEGFVVRLHILGDFYSKQYISVWAAALAWFPALHVFGYTARIAGDSLHEPIVDLNNAYPTRWVIRFSTNEDFNPSNPGVSYATNEKTEKGFLCPEMSGRTQSCLTCGLCWTVDASVWFPDHDELRKANNV